jgi:hypothetical protein
MVERQLPKLHTGVRFPSPALFTYENALFYALQMMQHGQTMLHVSKPRFSLVK